MAKQDNRDISKITVDFLAGNIVTNYNLSLFADNIPILIISVNRSENDDVIEKIKNMFRINDSEGIFRLILIVDHTVDVTDLFMVTWQLLCNTDPSRDHEIISIQSLLFDGTIKAFR